MYCQMNSQKSLTDKSSLTKPNPTAAGRPNRHLERLWEQRTARTTSVTTNLSQKLKSKSHLQQWQVDTQVRMEQEPVSLYWMLLNEHLKLQACNSTGNTFTQIWHYTATNHWFLGLLLTAPSGVQTGLRSMIWTLRATLQIFWIAKSLFMAGST